MQYGRVTVSVTFEVLVVCDIMFSLPHGFEFKDLYVVGVCIDHPHLQMSQGARKVKQ